MSEDRRLLESSVNRAEEDSVKDEVESLQRTVFKCRTELQEVERLLSEAEADLKDTRAKVCHNHTAQHFSMTSLKIASIHF